MRIGFKRKSQEKVLTPEVLNEVQRGSWVGQSEAADAGWFAGGRSALQVHVVAPLDSNSVNWLGDRILALDRYDA